MWFIAILIVMSLGSYSSSGLFEIVFAYPVLVKFLFFVPRVLTAVNSSMSCDRKRPAAWVCSVLPSATKQRKSLSGCLWSSAAAVRTRWSCSTWWPCTRLWRRQGRRRRSRLSCRYGAAQRCVDNRYSLTSVLVIPSDRSLVCFLVWTNRWRWCLMMGCWCSESMYTVSSYSTSDKTS